MVVLLLGNHVTAAFHSTVPVGLLSIHIGIDGIGLNLPANLIEQIELKLRQDQHGISNTHILHILLGGLNDIPGILSQRPVLRMIDDHGIAGHGQCGDGTERIDAGSIRIGNEHHVTLFNHCIAVVRCIEADAVAHHTFIEILGRNGHMTELAVDVHHFEVHHFDIMLFDHFHDLLNLVIHWNYPFSLTKYALKPPSI